MKAVIYARCSTDEDRQDVDKQIKDCERYCKGYGWKYDVIKEYVSGFKNVKRPKFDKLLEDIRLKKYDVLLVYEMSRFSRQQPHLTEEWLNNIVDKWGCQFISLHNPSLNSKEKMLWYAIKGLFAYFSHQYSLDLSESIKAGIRNKKEKGTYKGGRPSIYDRVNKFDVLKAYSQTGSYRKASRKLWNEQQIRISYISIQKIVKENQTLLN